MPIDYENLGDLKKEHEIFLRFLDRAHPTHPALPKFFHLLEKIHHHKEEKFLFPIMLGTERLQVGGPKCMTFFTPRVLGGVGWIDSFAHLNSLLPQMISDSLVTENSFREEVFSSGSMLKVPVGDHILGARAFALLGEEKNANTRIRILSALSSMLRDHIQREDECLFELFRAALSPEQKRTYANRARVFDHEHGTESLLSGLR